MAKRDKEEGIFGDPASFPEPGDTVRTSADAETIPVKTEDGRDTEAAVFRPKTTVVRKSEPEKRLDETVPGGRYRTPDGRYVDADGRPIKE